MQGQSDIPLNEEGREQAQRIAKRLAALDPAIDAVWSSDLQRARHTAEAIASPLGLSVTTTPTLREIGLGDWEGLTAEDIEARGDGELWQRYRLSPTGQRPPNGESLESAWERMIATRNQIREMHPSGHVVIVGHGGTLRALLAEALGAPLSSMLRFALANVSLSIIEEITTRQDRMSRILTVNDTSHLIV